MLNCCLAHCVLSGRAPCRTQSFGSSNAGFHSPERPSRFWSGPAPGHIKSGLASEDLILEGDRPNYVHLMQKGFACRYKILPDGGRSITAYLVPGDICDLHVSILGEMDHSIA